MRHRRTVWVTRVAVPLTHLDVSVDVALPPIEAIDPRALDRQESVHDCWTKDAIS